MANRKFGSVASIGDALEAKGLVASLVEMREELPPQYSVTEYLGMEDRLLTKRERGEIGQFFTMLNALGANQRKRVVLNLRAYFTPGEKTTLSEGTMALLFGSGMWSKRGDWANNLRPINRKRVRAELARKDVRFDISKPLATDAFPPLSQLQIAV